MSSLWNWIKNHPFISGGIVLLGAYLYYQKTRVKLILPPNNKTQIQPTRPTEPRPTPKPTEIPQHRPTPTQSPAPNPVPPKPVPMRVPTTPKDLKVLPPFSVVGVTETSDVKISSEDYQGKALIIFFYSRNVAHRTALELFQCAFSEIQALSISVLGCSKDNKFSHESLNATLPSPIPFPLIGDTQGELFDLFGVEDQATFIVSPDGKIEQRLETINIKEILPLLQQQN